MSAEAENVPSHAEKVRRGMELSRAHKAGEHTEPNPDCAKCKAEAKKGKDYGTMNTDARLTKNGDTLNVASSSPVPDVKPEVTLEGVSAPEAEDPPEKTDEQKRAEHLAAMKAAQEADQEAKTVIAPVANKPGEVGGDKTDYDILIHVLVDGLTALGTVWYRGQEIGIKRGSATDKLSTDTNGNRWYELTPVEQVNRFGVQYFAQGPWPFDKPGPTDDDGYIAALASGDQEAVRRYEKARQRAQSPIAPAGDRT
jgi:hypothetical protein